MSPRLRERDSVSDYRREHDLLGPRDVPADALWGIYTERAIENFPLARRPVHPALIHAYGAVKLACARTNHELGDWDEPTYAAIQAACQEMMEGMLDRHVPVDALQGGAGTSTHMNVNEVLANRCSASRSATTRPSARSTTSTATRAPTTPTRRRSRSPPSACCGRSSAR